MTQKRYGSIACFCILSLLFLTVFSPAAVSEDNDTIPDDKESELANAYAPYLYLHPDEKFHPTSPDYAISRSALLSIHGDGTPISDSPTVEMLDDYTDPEEGIYLDNREGTIDDRGIEDDFTASKSQFPPTIHARVTSGPSGEYVIQYWFFYPFNDGPLNRHEGDWEMISVFLDNTESPMYVGYSQHLGGERAGWGLTYRDGDHPKVYVALGSHANYLRPYEGGLGLARDEVSEEGRVLGPDDYEIVLLGEKGTGNHPDDQAWLDFAGHWGDYGAVDAGVRGERGPLGPVFFENGKRWDRPVEWASDLNEASDTWFTVNWLVANLLVIILSIMFFVILIYIILKFRMKRKQGTLGPRFLPFLYIDGANLKSLGLVIGIIALVLSIIGFFLPWYTVSVDVESGEYATDGPVEVLTIDGYHGLQFNKLDSGNGLVQLFGLPVPFLWILLMGMFIFFFGIVGIHTSRKMGRKFFGRGIITLLPIIIIVLFVALLASITSSYAGDAPPEVTEIIDEISASPFFGQTSRTLGDYGEADLAWGLGPGSLLFILASVMFFAAAVLEIRASSEFFTAPGLEKEPERKEGLPDEEELECEASEVEKTVDSEPEEEDILEGSDEEEDEV